jgi:hypothetical protein
VLPAPALLLILVPIVLLYVLAFLGLFLCMPYLCVVAFAARAFAARCPFNERMLYVLLAHQHGRGSPFIWPLLASPASLITLIVFRV